MESKIVFTGPPNAGKTTAIAALSDTAPIVTDVSNHDASLAKTRTTVGMDYGVVTLDGGDPVRLYGTPGQKRFDFMWRILVRNAIGIAILVDNSQPDPLSDLRAFASSLAPELRRAACVVGVGRTESHPLPNLDAFAEALSALGFVFPVVAVDVRQRADVLMLVELLLAQAEARETLEHE